MNLATQLLSGSVAAAIRTYVAFGKLESMALQTTDFIDKINRLFDVMNSQTHHATNKWKKPLRLSSKDQLLFLDECLEWLKSWKFIGTVSHRVKYSFPFLDGFLITVRSIKTDVTELLTTEHYSFILTSRFNQDALENFFSQIRSKGGNRAIHQHQSMKPHAKIIIIIIIIISSTSIFFQDESRVWTAVSE